MTVRRLPGILWKFLNQELEAQTTAELAGLEYEGINILADTDKAFELAVKSGDIKYLGVRLTAIALKTTPIAWIKSL